MTSLLKSRHAVQESRKRKKQCIGTSTAGITRATSKNPDYLLFRLSFQTDSLEEALWDLRTKNGVAQLAWQVS